MRRLTAALLLAALPLTTAATSTTRSNESGAATVYEIHYVRSVDNSLLRVEVLRPDQAEPVPVILKYSPYNSLGEPETADGSPWVGKGYAYAVADVLGTRGSSGCWDYGGLLEQQSGVDVVNHLAEQEWSNGNVGMTGVSYDGTTANMVAEAGDRAPGLKAVVPIAAISHWYGYAYFEGVRYFLNSFSPTDEGFDTPLAFDYGFGRTIPADAANDPQTTQGILESRTSECGSAEHTQRAYDPTPDQDGFWQDRDYANELENWKAATLLVHGWQDFNVKQDEAIRLFEALPEDDPATPEVEGVPMKLLWMTQSEHANGSGDGYQGLLDAFFAEHLKGETGAVERWRSDFAFDSGVDPLAVRSQGRTMDGPGEVTFSSTWPPATARDVDLHLGRWFDDDLGTGQSGLVGSTGETGVLSLEPQDTGSWTWVDSHTASELQSEEDPLNEPGHGYYSLYYQSPELAQDVRIAGRAVLDGWFNFANAAGAHLTPILLDIAPDGAVRVAERGFLNVDFREGRLIGEPAAGGQWTHAPVTFLPQDYTFLAGHRIAVILMSTNTIWAVPGQPAGTVNVANGPVEGATDVGTYLRLPVVDAPDDLATLFTEPAPTPPE